MEEFIKKKNIKSYFNNLPKSVLPENKKYSNKIMLDFALDQYIEDGSFEYLVYSTADIIVPSNFAESLIKIKEENFCSFIWPNVHIVNGNVKNTFWPHYGIDLIIFKLSLGKAKKFKEIIL